MTEAEWLVCENPDDMLKFLLDNASGRKLRLFAVACCRRVWHLLDDNDRRVVEVSERLADGSALNAERRAAALVAGRSASGIACCTVLVSPYEAAFEAAEAASVCASASVSFYLSNGQTNPAWERLCHAESAFHCSLLRDLFGPAAFRPVSVDPAWLAWSGGTIPKLAQGVYDDRAFDRLPILADALEEAGCTNGDILEHCRGQGPHVRGCWLIDLILGKT